MPRYSDPEFPCGWCGKPVGESNANRQRRFCTKQHMGYFGYRKRTGRDGGQPTRAQELGWYVPGVVPVVPDVERSPGERYQAIADELEAVRKRTRSGSRREAVEDALTFWRNRLRSEPE